jgi:hypothetical protein
MFGRPHYHLVIFGMDGGVSQKQWQEMSQRAHSFDKVGDLVVPFLYDKEMQANRKANADAVEFLSSCWKKGTVDVEGVTRKTIGAYITKYIIKSDMQGVRRKMNPDGKFIKVDEVGRLAPFLQMSKNPGIGFDWLQQHEAELRKGGSTPDLRYVGTIAVRQESYYDSYLRRTISRPNLHVPAPQYYLNKLWSQSEQEVVKNINSVQATDTLARKFRVYTICSKHKRLKQETAEAEHLASVKKHRYKTKTERKHNIMRMLNVNPEDRRICDLNE